MKLIQGIYKKLSNFALKLISSNSRDFHYDEEFKEIEEFEKKMIKTINNLFLDGKGGNISLKFFPLICDKHGYYGRKKMKVILKSVIIESIPIFSEKIIKSENWNAILNKYSKINKIKENNYKWICEFCNFKMKFIILKLKFLNHQ